LTGDRGNVVSLVAARLAVAADPPSPIVQGETPAVLGYRGNLIPLDEARERLLARSVSREIKSESITPTGRSRPAAKIEATANFAVTTRPDNFTAEIGSDVIVVLVNNPKKPGSIAHGLFSLYRSGRTTVAEFKRLAGKRGAETLRFDIQHRYIKIERR
jgi:hypothetical protein